MDDKLEQSRRYLKTHYSLHCSDKSTRLCSHNTSFALSDPKEKFFRNSSLISDAHCSDCFDLCYILLRCEDLACKSQDPEWIYYCGISIKSIFEFMKHKIRDVQQKRQRFMLSALLVLLQHFG